MISKAFAIGLGVAFAWLCLRMIDVFIWRSLEARFKTTIPRLLKDMVAVMMFVVTGITLAKVVFNQPVTAVWATSGAIAFVLGLAMQTTIADLFCGIAINVDQPFKINDWIEVHPRSVEPLKGCVTEISWRSTRIRTNNNTLIVVPNSALSSMILINLSRPEPRSRFSMVLCFDFGVPQDRVLRILLAGVKAAAGILENPEPRVLVHQLTATGVQYKVRYWVDPLVMSPRRARHEVASSLLRHLFQAGITPAYDKQDLYLSRMPNRQLDRQTDRETLLQRIELFSTLNREERRHLSESMSECQYRAGDVLVQQGEPGDSMYILVEGLLGVYLEKANVAASVKLAQIEPGQFFGEMSLLTGEKRSATVLAATDAVVFEISKADLCPLLDRRPQLAVTLAEVVAQRRHDQETKQQAQPEVIARAPSEQLLERMKDFFAGLRNKLYLL
ncbi:MAG: mechanosensitive ion channel [Phycisphaeraceae bacterium]|nr:mechanosensitive ion channel [Phycisphaeraceae bacterium]